jgi:large subunit ribosomal protein L1
MTKLSKRQKIINTKLAPAALYSVEEAVALFKSLPALKFVESVDVSVALGIDPRVSEQAVRGASLMPHGTGRTVRVAVFAQGQNVDTAKAAGADVVGFEDLAAQVKSGKMDFEVVIATPDAMRLVGQLGQILGPRGLMPNPKVGTVTTDVATAVKNAKSGQVQYRSEKGGIIHCTIGKISFEVLALKENLKTLLADLKKLRPASAKGVFLKKICLSTTMGPGLAIDPASLES